MNRVLIFGGLQLFVIFGVAACSTQANNHIQRTARVETVVFAGTQVGTVAALQATADGAVAMETQLAQLQQENESLLATIDAIQTFGVPPTQAQVVTTSAQTRSTEARPQFLDVQTTTGISQRTGCGLQEQARFSINASAVYLTMVGRGIQAGTTYDVRWYAGDELRYEADPWIPDQNFSETCIYFWLEPSDTPFEAGLWKVELFVNNEFIIEVPFEFCAADDQC